MAASFQFSIRFSFVVVAMIAAALGALTSFPSWRMMVTEQCCAFMFATTSIIAAMQSRGKPQAFWIGSAMVFTPAAGVSIYTMMYHLNDVFNFLTMSGNTEFAGISTANALRGPLAALWCAAPINGLFAVAVHWLLAPRSPSA